jgi:hypothetical protein
LGKELFQFKNRSRKNEIAFSKCRLKVIIEVWLIKVCYIARAKDFISLELKSMDHQSLGKE